jgi:hypothetical protein
MEQRETSSHRGLSRTPPAVGYSPVPASPREQRPRRFHQDQQETDGYSKVTHRGKLPLAGTDRDREFGHPDGRIPLYREPLPKSDIRPKIFSNF